VAHGSVLENFLERALPSKAFEPGILRERRVVEVAGVDDRTERIDCLL
jgi:hypothetical protein